MDGVGGGKIIDPYLIAKWIHILSSTVLFGTGIGTAFQMVWAFRTGRVETVNSVASGVVVADWIFTTPAGIIQPLSGLWLIWTVGYSLGEPWLLLSYLLYGVAFMCWVPVVRLQIRIRDITGQADADGGKIPAEAARLFRIWMRLGWPAFLALIGVFWLMIAKPQLWG